MGRAVYQVVRDDEDWLVKHETDVAGPYLTKEAAFEAAVAAASASLANGHAIELTVEGGEGRWG